MKGTSFAVGGPTSGITRKNGEPKEKQYAESLLFSTQRRSTSPQDFSFSTLNATRSGLGTSTFGGGLSSSFAAAGGPMGAGGVDQHSGHAGSPIPSHTSIHSGGATVGQLVPMSPPLADASRQNSWLHPTQPLKETEELLDDEVSTDFGYKFGAPTGLGIRQRRPHQNSSEILEMTREEEEEDEAPPTRSLLDGASLSHTGGAPDSLSSKLNLPSGGAHQAQGSASRAAAEEDGRLRAALQKGGAMHLNLATTAFEQERWGRWVVAFGFTSATEKAALADLQACGRVQEQLSGHGNWLFIRYETRLQAEKAICRNGILLTPNIMLGVCRLDNQMATRLNFRLNKEGAGVLEHQPPKDKGTEDILKRKRQFLDDNDDDILIQPKKRDGVCTRLMKYFFNS